MPVHYSTISLITRGKGHDICTRMIKNVYEHGCVMNRRILSESRMSAPINMSPVIKVDDRLEYVSH
jgi:hypothetical protein